MAAYSNYALRVPGSLMDDLRHASMRDGVSMNGFIIQAVAEKVAAMRARGVPLELSLEEQTAFFEARIARGRESGESMADILARAGTTNEVLPGDEIPEGYWESAGDQPATPLAPRRASRR
jgi:hypothetical protein